MGQAKQRKMQKKIFYLKQQTAGNSGTENRFVVYLFFFFFTKFCFRVQKLCLFSLLSIIHILLSRRMLFDFSENMSITSNMPGNTTDTISIKTSFIWILIWNFVSAFQYVTERSWTTAKDWRNSTHKGNIKRRSMFLMCSEKVRATDNDCVSIKIDISFQVKIVFIYLYKYLYYI